jgi:lysophospholipase L1-like esterase
MRVLVFGASITQGFWDTKGGWVQRLRSHYDTIKTQDISKEDEYPDIFNLGISGNTTKDVLNRLQNETKARITNKSNSAIVFSIGTNNAAVEVNGKEWSTPEEYRTELEEIISQTKELTAKIIFVGLPCCDESRTTPVSWLAINYTNERLLLFDKVAREVCLKHNIAHIAIYEPMQKQLNKGTNLFEDGLHPNNEGHELIFKLVQPELDRLLKI